MQGHPFGILYTGTASELTALARLRRDGDMFYATDTGSLYVRVAGEWRFVAESLVAPAKTPMPIDDFKGSHE